MKHFHEVLMVFFFLFFSFPGFQICTGAMEGPEASCTGGEVCAGRYDAASMADGLSGLP